MAVGDSLPAKERLQSEGGSDVFSSTRHVNNVVSRRSKSRNLEMSFFSFFSLQDDPNSNKFKTHIWSNDDAPLVRPLLKTEPYQHPPIGVSSMKTKVLDGYGGEGCERITLLASRTGRQWFLGYAAVIIGASTFCALLLKLKKPKKAVMESS